MLYSDLDPIQAHQRPRTHSGPPTAPSPVLKSRQRRRLWRRRNLHDELLLVYWSPCVAGRLGPGVPQRHSALGSSELPQNILTQAVRRAAQSAGVEADCPSMVCAPTSRRCTALGVRDGRCYNHYTFCILTCPEYNVMISRRNCTRHNCRSFSKLFNVHSTFATLVCLPNITWFGLIFCVCILKAQPPSPVEMISSDHPPR
jgi:hypothetical protein